VPSGRTAAADHREHQRAAWLDHRSLQRIATLPAVGSSKFLRIYDYNTNSSSSGTDLEYDFVARLRTRRRRCASVFKFAATANLGTNSKTLRFSVVKTGLSMVFEREPADAVDD